MPLNNLGKNNDEDDIKEGLKNLFLLIFTIFWGFESVMYLFELSVKCFTKLKTCDSRGGKNPQQKPLLMIMDDKHHG